MENIIIINNNNIVDVIGFKVDNLIIKYFFNIFVNEYFKIDRNNFKFVNIDGIENVIFVV